VWLISPNDLAAAGESTMKGSLIACEEPVSTLRRMVMISNGARCEPEH
jgi:hypothetical protein